ncbi:MAG: hypothetical protein J7M15_02895 [Anaerolineae bacterium]|nr:hypothetical protein [Anaerolineae bacterium]
MARTKKARSAAARRARSRRTKKSQEVTVDFAREYRYVVADLKRLAVVATAMFALLVILALILL